MRSRFSYANVTATVALFAAVGGGGAYAASAITGHDVRNGSLTGKDLRNNSVAGVDVRNRSLLARDFMAGQIPAGAPGKGTAAKGVNGDQPVTLTAGADWVTILAVNTTTSDAGQLLFSGAVEESATSKTDTGTVVLRIVHNGHVHPLASNMTVGPGESDVGLALFECDEDPGDQAVQLQAQATGADIQIGNRHLSLAQTTELP
jgi:hypothetical protein